MKDQKFIDGTVRRGEMVDRVAKAIESHAASIGMTAIDTWWTGAAISAIEAMREPTESMMNAYTLASNDDNGPAACFLQPLAYQAMIDEALK